MSTSAFDALAVSALAGATDRNIVIGPALWHPETGTFFVIATNRGGFHTDLVKRDGSSDIFEIREGVIQALGRRGKIVHDMGDEGETASRCQELWPCAATAKIAKQLESERKIARMIATTPRING